VRPLVAELNTLLDENAVNLERARRHVANLAHGLKAPLATLALALAEPERDHDRRLLPLVTLMDRRIPPPFDAGGGAWGRGSRPVSPSLALHSASGRRQSLSARSRRAFAITETELSDIASAPTIGLRRMPKAG
jgi:hypothetical protein